MKSSTTKIVELQAMIGKDSTVQTFATICEKHVYFRTATITGNDCIAEQAVIEPINGRTWGSFPVLNPPFPVPHVIEDAIKMVDGMPIEIYNVCMSDVPHFIGIGLHIKRAINVTEHTPDVDKLNDELKELIELPFNGDLYYIEDETWGTRQKVFGRDYSHFFDQHVHWAAELDNKGYVFSLVFFMENEDENMKKYKIDRQKLTYIRQYGEREFIARCRQKFDTMLMRCDLY